jgi:hypothetical protein
MQKINIDNLNLVLNEYTQSVKQYINLNVFKKTDKKYIESIIDDILKAVPSEFENIISSIKEKRIPLLKLKKAFLGGKKYGGSVGYTKFSNKNAKPYNAYDLAQKLNVNVCPYCNRNYTFTTTNSGKNTRPDFDHFYSKEKHPILALSFYNLIPSCILCNSRLKGKKEFSLGTHMHPYHDSFNEHVKFTYEIKNSTFLFSEDGFELKLETSDKRANENIKDFALDVLYERHKDIVLELIQKREIYPDSYIDELLKNYEGIVFSSRDDLMRLITCGYVKDEDINKRPLSKLIKDISEELEFV